MEKQNEEMARDVAVAFDNAMTKKHMFSDCIVGDIAGELVEKGYKKEKRSEWITTLKSQMDRINAYIHRCKNCGYDYESIRPYGSSYCPDCGAMMEDR